MGKSAIHNPAISMDNKEILLVSIYGIEAILYQPLVEMRA